MLYPTELPRNVLGLDSNQRPPACQSEVSATYTTGLFITPLNPPPGNERKEFGTSSQRCLSHRGYAPAPQGDLFRQARPPAGSVGGDVTLLYHHRRTDLLTNTLTLSAAIYSSPRQKHLIERKNRSRGNNRRQGPKGNRLTVEVPGFFATRGQT